MAKELFHYPTLVLRDFYTYSGFFPGAVGSLGTGGFAAHPQLTLRYPGHESQLCSLVFGVDLVAFIESIKVMACNLGVLF